MKQEVPIELILEVEENSGFDLSSVHDDHCFFDSCTTSFYIKNCNECYMFVHNKHYYPFNTIKEFNHFFHEHMYRYYDLGERDFDIY